MRPDFRRSLPVSGLLCALAFGQLERTLASKNPDAATAGSFPKPPSSFNPDPGSWSNPSPQTVEDNVAERPMFGGRLVPGERSVPYGTEPILPSLTLPRQDVVEREPEFKEFAPHGYLLGNAGQGLLPNSKAFPDRWRVPLPHWQRYLDPSVESAYLQEKPRIWHPYYQSLLKGDLPIFGQDLFTSITAKNFTLTEFRRLPVASGVSTLRPNSAEFFGRGDQATISTDTSVGIDLFRGETAFKPVSWLFRINVVDNENWIWTKENNQLNPDPRGSDVRDSGGNPNIAGIQAVTGSGNPGSFLSTVNPAGSTSLLGTNVLNFLRNQGLSATPQSASSTRYTYRQKSFLSLQEAFLETHISDLSDTYDFVTSRVGIQPFVSDFRGFIFSDSNLGARVFGSADTNRFQYNLLYFNMREKDTYSELNTFQSRDQQVIVANVYRQDLLWKGYTGQLSFHANIDGGKTKYDRNGLLVRPEPFGTVPDDESFGGPSGHHLQAYYLGWAGDGHIGKLNVNHAFYQVLGQDDFNQFAGQRVNINAQMAALELSLDRDWIRFKVSGFYASGDSNPTDGKATGFDSILDNPFFVGGPFSWYVREGIGLAGTNINLKERNSLVTAFRTSKTQGQSNFVNPGVMIVGVGTDVDVTPKMKAFGNLNYIKFAETAPIKYALQTNRMRSDLGVDASVGIKYRPFLTENVIISAGVGVLLPGGGYRDIYRQNTVTVPGFDDQSKGGKTDPFLYNALLTLTLTY